MEISTVDSRLPQIHVSQTIVQLCVSRIHQIRQFQNHTHLAFEYSPTIQSVFVTFASSIYADQLKWHKIHLYPLDSAQKAQMQLEEKLFKHVDFPPHHFHPQIPLAKTFDILIFQPSSTIVLPQSHYHIQIK